MTEISGLNQSLNNLDMNTNYKIVNKNDNSLKKKHKKRKNKKLNKTNEKTIIESKDPEETEVEDMEEDIGINDEIKEKQNSKLKFKFCGYIKGNSGYPLYGIQFNHYLPKGENYFATVGSNSVTIYECLKNGNNRLVQCFSDPKKDEDYWTCVWSYDEITGNPFILCAGLKGVIRVIDCGLKTCVKHFIGHGSGINELKISPYDPNLLLSSSRDLSLRLWNIKTGICVVKFGGIEGHRDQVISADFHLLSNKYIISSGMDHSIKIWSIDKQNIKNAIKESEVYEEGKKFDFQVEHFPLFSTRDVHNNYVDCIQFFGNFVLSKSLEDQIICWKPKQLDSEIKNCFPDSETNKSFKEITIIDVFPIEECKVWFIKFSMDEKQELLAVGNTKGVTYVWDTDLEDPFDVKPAKLTHEKCKSTIRQTSFSSDGTILICVCEDSTIWRWSLSRN